MVRAKTVPGISSWSMHAGGISVPGGKRGYDLFLPVGRYMVDPIANRHGRFLGYQVMFVNEKGRLGGGLYQSIGMARSPAEGAKMSREHYGKHFGEGDKNPGASWHRTASERTHKKADEANKIEAKEYWRGASDAHKKSEWESQDKGLANPRRILTGAGGQMLSTDIFTTLWEVTADNGTELGVIGQYRFPHYRENVFYRAMPLTGGWEAGKNFSTIEKAANWMETEHRKGKKG